MKKYLILVISCAFLLGGCTQVQKVGHYAKKIPYPKSAKSQGKYKIGSAYKIKGKWYKPKEDFNLVQTGIASWYGTDFHGKKTANGEIYDQFELTAAHKTLQLPALVKVTNLENGRSVVVRVNDRGPYAHGRIIDMSRKGAELLGFKNKGITKVKIQVLAKESRALAAAAKSGKDTRGMTAKKLSRLNSSSHQPRIIREKAPDMPALRAIPVTSEPIEYVMAQPKKVAYLKNDAVMVANTDDLTVETLSVDDVLPNNPDRFLNELEFLKETKVQGHSDNGRFMPNQVVSHQKPVKTGTYVQIGSFSSYDNAQALIKKSNGLGKSIIKPAQINGREFYRVRIGPFSKVADADYTLNKAIKRGYNDAKIVLE